jgi:hypothetical protein
MGAGREDFVNLGRGLEHRTLPVTVAVLGGSDTTRGGHRLLILCIRYQSGLQKPLQQLLNAGFK